LARPSEEIQTITTQGTWDGVGDFEISLTGGQVEIVGLSLLDKSFEDYCKQTDSHIMQSVENINKELDFLEQIVKRFTLVQSHVNQLYSNDTALKSLLDKQATLIEELKEADRVIGEALEGIHSVLSSHDSRITSNKNSISGILNTLSELEEWKTSIGTDISGINTSIANLDKRISELEKSGAT
jgi:chromosome segregation ATPase